MRVRLTDGITESLREKPREESRPFAKFIHVNGHNLTVEEGKENIA